MRELDEIMADLRKGFDGLTEAEQTQIAAQLAGQEAMSGLLAIVNTSEDEYNKLADAINNADGAAKDMADTMANNLQGKLTLLKSSAEGFGLALYEKIKAPLTEMASWGVESLNELTKAFNEKGVDGVVSAAGNILSEAIAAVVDKLPEFVDLAVSVIESFVNGLSENQETITNGAISIITTLANGILNMLPQIVALGLDLIVSLANGIAESLPTLIPTIVDVIFQIVDTLTNPETLSKLLEASLAIITQLAWGLVDNIPVLIDAVFVLVDNIVDFLTEPENLGKLIGAAIELVVAIGVGLVKAIPKLLVDLGALIMSIVDAFGNFDWGQLGRNLVEGFKKGIKNAWNRLKTWFNNLFNDLVGGAKKILGIASPSKVFKTIGGFTAEGFGQGWNDAFGEIKKSITKDLDFGEAKIGVSTNASRNLQRTTQGYHNASNDYPMTIIVQSVLDGKVIGETAYKYARGQHRALGVV